jgi:hypothetical protein
MTVLAPLAALLVVASGATGIVGCGDEDLRARPVVEAPSKSPTADKSTSDPVTVSYRGSSGTATLTIRVGAAQAAETAADPGAVACARLLARMGQAAGAMSIPITVTGEVTSGSGPLVARIGSLYEIVDGEIRDLRYSGVMFGVKYSDFAPQCDQDTDAGTVRWEKGSGSWSTWVVVPASSTSSGGPGSVLISPGVSVGSGFGGDTELSGGQSTPLVRCGQAAGSELPPAYVALDRAFALESGCLTSGGAQATPITDRICHAAYPNGGSTTANGNVTYDREASLGQMCNGFGLGRGQITPGMRCALIATAAIFDKSTVAPVDRLCDAREIVQAFETGSWISAAKTLACGGFGSLFAEAAGLTAAARFASPAVGVNTYRAMAAAVPVACDGISGGGEALGEYLESRRHADVRNDILRHGKCLQIKTSNSHFSAVDCP